MRTIVMLLFPCLIAGCNQPKQQTIEEKSLEETVAQAQVEVVVEEDTTIYDMPYNTAFMEGGNEYFRKNNRYKDWDKNNSQRIVVGAIIEKDGAATNIEIRSKDVEYPELKEEAIRLIQEAKIRPALNESGEAVRSKWVNIIHFPAK